MKQSNSEKITVTLENNITKGGRSSSVDYKIWTKEYKSQFYIFSGAVSSGKHEAIANLKAGQMVDLYINRAELENLSDQSKEINIIGISRNGIPLMSTDEFYHNRDLYKFRLKIFSLFIALMLILNGLIQIPNKFNYIIIGTFIATIILLRTLEIGIY